MLMFMSSGWIGNDLLPKNKVVLTSTSHGKVQMGPVEVRFWILDPGMCEYIASATGLKHCDDERGWPDPGTLALLWDLVERKAGIENDCYRG